MSKKAPTMRKKHAPGVILQKGKEIKSVYRLPDRIQIHFTDNTSVQLEAKETSIVESELEEVLVEA